MELQQQALVCEGMKSDPMTTNVMFHRCGGNIHADKFRVRSQTVGVGGRGGYVYKGAEHQSSN